MSELEKLPDALEAPAKLEIEAAIEEYEINLRQELDEITQRQTIEKKKSSLRQELIRRELEALHADEGEIRREEHSLINWTLILSLGISVIVVALFFAFIGELDHILRSVSTFMSANFSWFYVLVSSSFLIFLGYLAFSRFGSVVLGDPNQRPEFGNFSWYSMLFSAGMGVGILFNGVAEPLMHFKNAPGVTPETADAARHALTLSAFHWGFHAWGIYTVCAVGVAYYGFRKRKKYLISSSIMDLSQNKKVMRTAKLSTDVIATLAIIFGVAASLGLGMQQMSGGIEYVTGYDVSSKLGYFVILAIIAALYVVSSSTGLERGIKILSNLNMIIAIALVAFVFVVGPRLFSIKLFVDSIGQYLEALPSLSFKVNPFNAEYEEWMRGWTLSYLAWWIAWSPFVGIFIARISRGRTIRELVLGSLIVPALFCILWFAIFGGAALRDELAGGNLSAVVESDIKATLFHFLDGLPLSTITSYISLFLIATFLITSADSATFVISMMTSEGDLDPSQRMKIMWGVILAVISYLLVVGGGLEALKAASLFVSLPFSFVLILMALSLSFRLSIQMRGRRH